MGPPLHAKNETAVEAMRGIRKFCVKNAKRSKAAGTLMASVFWDAKYIPLIDCHEKGRAITDVYYTKVLDQLKDKIRDNLA
ncbi:hypothetical protein TNCV_2537861 [Trichonephila clavipes]|nr:hypothetical protein TNCV_2537861 [Trichonephila clavipes]